MNKKIYIGIGLFFIIFVGLVVYFLIPKSYINFKVAPEQALVLINGKDEKNINNGDTITVSPGKYKITVFRDEFKPYSTNIDLKNGETVEVVAALVALTDNAKKLLNNENSSYVIEKSTAINMDKEIEQTVKLNPIMKELPIESRSYFIASCPSELFPEDSNKIALCIDIPMDSFKDTVKSDIKSRGYDPESFEYIWNVYLNPDEQLLF